MNTAKGFFNFIDKYYHQLYANEIILAYDGDITHQLMKAFVSIVEERLEEECENESIQKKLFHILVECLQNITRHAEEIIHEKGKPYPRRGAILLYKQTTHYQLVTVNIIKKKQVKELKAFLENINPLSQDELTKIYKKQLMEGSISSKGGAGLGLIDIRRKTGNEMEFDFIDHNDENSYFLFKITVTRK